MVDVSSVALSGIAASETRLSVAANNIANADTKGFRAQTVSQTSDANGGVSTQVVAKNPAPATTQTSASQLEGNDVDIGENVIDANFATYSAQASIKVLQTQDKLNKHLLDIQA